MRAFLRLLCVFALVGISTSAFSQQNYSYSGGVTRVVKLRILPGKTSDFYKYLGNVSKVLAAEQAAGLVDGYSFAHSINYEGADKYDVAVVVHYKDLASYETLAAKADPVIAKVYGSPEARAAAGKLADESSELVSSELVRGIVLK